MKRFVRTVRAELVKLAGLPAVAVTTGGTIAAGGALGAAVAASSGADATRSVLAAVPWLQAGTILLGILAIASEYAGGQIRTSLTASPVRLRLLGAKALACLLVTAVASALSVGCGVLAAAAVLDGGGVDPGIDGRPLAGAAGYLVLIGLLGFALAVLLRSLVPPLVAMLGLVLIVSPLLASRTDLARWLPDRAGALLYQPPPDTVLTPFTGGLVLFGWITAMGIAGSVAFVARDA